MSYLQEKINSTISALTAKSREQFETTLADIQKRIYLLLQQEEAEMKLQELEPSFHFNFKIAVEYVTEAGPLFPPMPAAPVAAPARRRAKYLRQSAGKPAGFYAE